MHPTGRNVRCPQLDTGPQALTEADEPPHRISYTLADRLDATIRAAYIGRSVGPRPMACCSSSLEPVALQLAEICRTSLVGPQMRQQLSDSD